MEPKRGITHCIAQTKFMCIILMLVMCERLINSSGQTHILVQLSQTGEIYLQNTEIIYSISRHDLGPNKDQGRQEEMEGLRQRQRRLIYIKVERLAQAY